MKLEKKKVLVQISIEPAQKSIADCACAHSCIMKSSYSTVCVRKHTEQSRCTPSVVVIVSCILHTWMHKHIHITNTQILDLKQKFLGNNKMQNWMRTVSARKVCLRDSLFPSVSASSLCTFIARLSPSHPQLSLSCCLSIYSLFTLLHLLPSSHTLPSLLFIF